MLYMSVLGVQSPTDLLWLKLRGFKRGGGSRYPPLLNPLRIDDSLLQNRYTFFWYIIRSLNAIQKFIVSYHEQLGYEYISGVHGYMGLKKRRRHQILAPRGFRDNRRMKG